MVKRLLFALIIFLIPYGAMAAQDQCITAEQVLNNDQSKYPELAVIADLTMGEAQAFLARINATPPETHYAGDRLVMISAEQFTKVKVLIIKDGCIVHGFMMPKKIVLDWLGLAV